MSEEFRKVLLQARIIWAALLMGPLVFFAIVVYLHRNGMLPEPAEDLGWLYVPLAWGMAAVMSITGMVMRSFMLRGSLRGDLPPPQRWLAAHIVVWAFCEGAALLGVTLCFITAELTPYAYAAALAWAVQVAFFPKGSVD
ncbi:MAG: hypothetical protein ACYTDY_18640 [Planctomycetota bacterium]|jgi:hypothetical protein